LASLQPILKAMVDGCPPGAHFLFIDRADAQTNAKIDTLVADLNLETVGESLTRDNMDSDEQSGVLQDFIDAIGKQPRVTWNGRWTLTAKPQKT
jgi:hypothetical protein